MKHKILFIVCSLFLSFALAGCDQTTSTLGGGALGAIAGAGVGSAIGGGEGALIGALVGGFGGAAIGSDIGQKQQCNNQPVVHHVERVEVCQPVVERRVYVDRPVPVERRVYVDREVHHYHNGCF